MGDNIGDKLTAKQQCFVNEYLIDLNATQAAIRAGYSEKTAHVIGHENLNKPKLQASIQAAMLERATNTGITAERVLSEIAKLAFVNPQDFLGEDGDPLPLHKLPRDIAAAYGVKPGDKKGNLELLGRHLKMFTDKTELASEGGGPIVWQVEVVHVNKDKNGDES